MPLIKAALSGSEFYPGNILQIKNKALCVYKVYSNFDSSLCSLIPDRLVKYMTTLIQNVCIQKNKNKIVKNMQSWKHKIRDLLVGKKEKDELN